MKYWILTTEYPPFFGGGIATYCKITASVFSKNGHQVSVFIYDPGSSDLKITIEEGVRIVRFPLKRTKAHQFLGFNAALSYEYAEIAGHFVEREGVPDIVEAQEYNGIAYYLQQFKLLKYKHFSDLTILVTCHAPSFLCLEYNQVPIFQFPAYWTGQMEKSSIRCANILVSPSRYFIKEAKKRMNWTGIEVKYLVNPVNLPGIDKPAIYSPNYIVCFGKLSPLKGTFELLRYFKGMWDKGFNYSLHIIGGTKQIFHPEGLTMEDVVKRSYGEYIKKKLLILEGEYPANEVRKRLSMAHVVIIPSIVDNLPYTVLEAMSFGKIVLASKQGGQSEVITDGENGFLFDHFIEHDFENKLRYILNSDEKSLDRIANNAIKTIKSTFSPEIVYDQKLSLIKAYLKNPPPVDSFPFPQQDPEKASESNQPGVSNDLLSVIIPFFNMGEYVEECIKSVLSADYSNKEILIIDDGSTDEESLKKLKQIESTYPVKVHYKKNEGLSLTRNFGASKATGSFIAFLDPDDTVEKTYYSKALTILNSYSNVHYVGCWTQYFGGSNQTWPAFNPEFPYFLLHNMINSSALIFRKDSFINYGLNDPELIYGMEDWESVIRMNENNCCGVVLPEILFNYRVRTNSMSRAFTSVKRLHLYRLIALKHQKLYNTYGAEIANILNANGSGVRFDNPTFEIAQRSSFSIRLSGIVKEKIKGNKYLRTIAYKLYRILKN